MIWLWGLLLLMAACGDDDYYYPSVKMEFVTIEAGDDGRIRTLIPDKGDILPVSQDLTGSTISPNTSRRVMSNYETMEEGAKIYSCSRSSHRLLNRRTIRPLRIRKAKTGRGCQYLAWTGLFEYDS